MQATHKTTDTIIEIISEERDFYLCKILDFKKVPKVHQDKLIKPEKSETKEAKVFKFSKRYIDEMFIK